MENKNMEKKKEKMDLKKISIIAGIAAVVLIVVLVASIVLSNATGLNQIKKDIDIELGTVTELALEAKDYFKVNDEVAEKIKFDTSEVDLEKVGEYKATASYKSKTYTIKVNVVDTTAPQVTMAHRYVFTNDVASVDISGLFEGIYDASEYTAKLIRFERSGNLSVMDDNALNSLTETINTAAKDDGLKELGTADLPTEEGVYRAVVEVADVHGNTAYEEVYVILDKTGALIEDVADKTITVSAENLSAEPAVDKSEYHITDNVDGKIAADAITCQLELRDAAKHEWLVHVSYVDRAGNESKADFLIIVKEGNTAQTGNGGSANQGGNKENTGNGDSSNQDGNTNTDTNKKPTNNQDVSTWNPSDYDENEINPYQQIIIDAGYGNVVDWGDGTYSVLVHKDLTANGKNGREILEEYLAARDLDIVKSQAGIIDEANDWYVYSVDEVRELITPDEEEFWD